MGLKQFFVAKGSLHFLSNPDLEERLIDFADMIEQKGNAAAGEKGSEEIQSKIVKSLFIISKELKKENPDELWKIAEEIFGPSPKTAA